MIKVIDVICSALQLLDRADITEAYEGGSLTDEQNRTLSALLHCYNSVEDELSRIGFPLIEQETVTVTDGKFYFADLSRSPYKFLEATCGTKPIKYKLTPKYIETNAPNIDITYTYCPEKKGLEDEGEYDGLRVSERLMAYGLAAEYCLIQGDIEDSKSWEYKYRLAVDTARRLSPARRYIPPRRWA